MAQEVMGLMAVLADVFSTESNLLVTPAAKSELLRLRDELTFIKKFISDSAREPQAAELLRELDLEGPLKEVVCDVEDTLQSSMAELAAAKARNIFLRPLLIPRIGNALARNLESIRYGRLERITRSIHTYTIKQTPHVEMDQQIEEFPSKKIVGFEDESETLISSLVAKSQKLSVIAITGMPGIGKTTLAWKIYQDERIRHQFPTRIWVRRSNDLRLSFLKQLIEQDQEFAMWLGIPQQSCSSKAPCLEAINKFSNLDIRKKVTQCLKKSRYLLVMDAVWDAAAWSSVVELLPKTGKVLITSGNHGITKKSHHGITKKSHVLRFLDEKESWELLQLEVFGMLDECPEMLISTGESIARKCHGSPLAIVAVASSLVVRPSTEAAADLTATWWKMVSEDVTTYLRDYGQHHHRVFSRVELSYNLLSHPLKESFLYLGVFPQDHEISVRELIRLWIAEGFVPCHSILTLEEVAKENLDDLVYRNLVMVGKIYPNGRIETCRLHPLMYGFCKFKAAEQDFYREIKTCNRPISLELTSSCHRLCIRSGLSNFLSTEPKGEFEHISSILCLNNTEEKVLMLPSHNSAIYKCFKLLEVLECKNISFTEFPKKLTKLASLKYISLSCDDLAVIPESVSSLHYLETLVVDTRSPSLEMKANIWKMNKLRHLVTKAAFALAIRGKGDAGKNLHTLTRLAPACCTEDVFTRIPNLKTLGIRGPLASLSDANSLRKLMFLENLKLVNESAAECRLHRLLHPDCFPPYLERLTLSGTCLGWECMAILGKINLLEILKLKNNAFIGESWSNTDAKGFRSLGFLSIGTTDLASWEASPDCFPRLKRLVLKNCQKLEKIPSTLSKSLHTLDVENVSESAADSAREIEQEILRRRGKSKGKVA